MKYFFALALFLALLTSCTSMMISHRMKAAQRKLLETRRLEQAGQWPEALAMSEKLHGSVAKSISSRPVRPGAGGAQVDLRPLLVAWENGPFAELQAALKKQDSNRTNTALVSLRQQCVTCHSVLGKTDIQLPEIQ